MMCLFLDEEAPFEPRDVKIRSGCWITEEYDVLDVLLGRYVCCAQNVTISNSHGQLSMRFSEMSLHIRCVHIIGIDKAKTYSLSKIMNSDVCPFKEYI